MKLELSEHLRRLRRERNLSQEQLAETLGVSVPSVSRWETGATYPDIEMLPTLAGFFGVTTDELLGVSGALRERRIQKYWEDFEKASNADDVEEAIAILRRAYAEFPEEWLFGVDLCEVLGFHTDGHADEVRRIVYDALERCTDTGSRKCFIQVFASIETDDRIEEFLRSHSDNIAQTTSELLELRYMLNGPDKHALYVGTRLYNQVTKMKEILLHPIGDAEFSNTPDVMACRCRAGLDFLNTVVGIVEEQRRTHPVSGDGTPDLWARTRAECAMNLSRALSAAGRAEEALNVLEELVELYEQIYRLPEASVFSYRLEPSGLLDAEIRRKTDEEYGDTYISARFLHHIGCRLHGTTEEEIAYERYCDTFSARVCLQAMEREMFDSLREYPRFLACVDRLRTLAFSQT